MIKPAASILRTDLLQYKNEVVKELSLLLDWWAHYMPDTEKGGFYGSVNNGNQPDRDAVKGVVLNSRILWTFAAAYNYTGHSQYLALAERAWHYMNNFFVDKACGGVYWSVNADGTPHDTRKQIYGIAFCIYGLSEYYRATSEAAVLDTAIALYHSIEQHSLDKVNNGYVEAFSRNWQPVEDLRLSVKDDNERKTMNTHLHIVEAYANLYSVWKDEHLRSRIVNLLLLFDRHFIDHSTFHCNLFFNDEWELKSGLQSFGHDIEAAWLLQQCAAQIGDDEMEKRFAALAVPVTDAVVPLLDMDGGLWYEYNPVQNRLIKEKHSWPQAEAMIGFMNAYQLTGNESYLQRSMQSWFFIKTYIKDPLKGEWFWGVDEQYNKMDKEKAGFWKCPYHSGRACIEISKRITTLLN
jgi:cellobiose epimerase